MKSEEKNQQAGLNDIAGNVGAGTPAADAKMGPGAQNTLGNSATQAETPGMKPGPASGVPTPLADPQSPQSPAASQSLAAAEMSVGKGAVASEGDRQENKEANPTDLVPGAPARRGRKPGTPNKPKDGAPQSAPATKTGASGRPRKVTPEASSDSGRDQPTTYGGNFGNDVQNSFQDQGRYQNQVSGVGRGEFGTQDYQGGTHGGYGNQYREFDFENRNSAEDRYYGGPGRYGSQHNAYRDYDGRDEQRGGQQPYRGGNAGYGDQNGGRGGNFSNQGGYNDNHGYDRHGFNQQGGHYYGPNEGYDPRHAGGYGYSERDRRPAGRDQRDQSSYYGNGNNNAGSYGAGRGNYPQPDNRSQQSPRGYDDGRGNRQDNRNQPDRDDPRSGFQNDNGAGPGRTGLGYANDYGQSSIGGGDYGYGRGREQQPNQNYNAGYERRNQDEDGRSSRGGYDNQGSGGGREGHQGDNARYGQQGYQGGYGSGADERGRQQQGGPAQNQGADPRRQPTEGYGHGRDEQARRPDYRTGDQRNGYGRSFGGDSQQGYGSRGGSYNDEYDNGNGGQGGQNGQGGTPGSPAQGNYTQQERNRNYGPGARQEFRPDQPAGEKEDYGSAPRRNAGRDGDKQE